MNHRIDSKTTKVKHHLKAGNSLTPLQAVGLYGLFRLAPVVHRLRGEMFILTAIRTAPTGSKYAEYMAPKIGTKVLSTYNDGRGVGTVVSIVANRDDPFFTIEWERPKAGGNKLSMLRLCTQDSVVAV